MEQFDFGEFKKKKSMEQKGEIERSVACLLMKIITAQGTESDRPAKSSTL